MAIRKTLNKIKTAITKPHLISYHLTRKKRKWEGNSDGFAKKGYSSYKEYLEHQKDKLRKKDLDYHKVLGERDTNYRKVLYQRLKKSKLIKPGMSALCLAARTGTEVKSFLDIGCFSIGVDLNPGKDNRYVVYGDFHNLPFSKNSVDVIFSNSLDHAFDLERMSDEIKRMLKKSGILILEISDGEEEDNSFEYYEATRWKKSDDVVNFFLKSGFKLVKSSEISDYPFNGKQVFLKLKKG